MKPLYHDWVFFDHGDSPTPFLYRCRRCKTPSRTASRDICPGAPNETPLPPRVVITPEKGKVSALWRGDLSTEPTEYISEQEHLSILEEQVKAARAAIRELMIGCKDGCYCADVTCGPCESLAKAAALFKE